MKTGNNPGSPAEYVILAGSSKDGQPHGGSDDRPPEMANRRVQIAKTNHPATDRWLVLTTVRIAPSPLYRVGVVDGLNRPVSPASDYPTLRRAHNAANKLHEQLTKEN
ncbi:hypothetical protein [Nocardioides sp. cx-173]|uniref:hypothetical protein n=1 Tax=Nocardioides sp. cx-173 TaxID=2898796 RepID=UPI001E3A6823|nr:hypothetical protein [Nocardioides sp. cx-173]MCD4527449.1 hypothetical protein [Nocardioides sp. cx-173]UGB40411.1 hypothetical protein LQ940_13595 [Nocardioides sp. cx-173]